MIKSPCDICLDEKCSGKYNCKCETCKDKETCPRNLRATIRITSKCTQACNHCCYSCSPKNNKHMSIKMAEKVSVFLKNNDVVYANIMGGEIFCNPDYKEILRLIIPSVKVARLVTNGDWVEQNEDFAVFLKEFPNCYVSISKDKWHTNKNIEKAEEILKENSIRCDISKLTEDEDSIVPVGNGWGVATGLFSMFGCYCQNIEHKYTFLIDEDGIIYKCGFGIWNYADVIEYKDDFRARFKEFNNKFYGLFISNCSKCAMSYNFNR